MGMSDAHYDDKCNVKRYFVIIVHDCCHLLMYLSIYLVVVTCQSDFESIREVVLFCSGETLEWTTSELRLCVCNYNYDNNNNNK